MGSEKDLQAFRDCILAVRGINEIQIDQVSFDQAEKDLEDEREECLKILVEVFPRCSLGQFEDEVGKDPRKLLSTVEGTGLFIASLTVAHPMAKIAGASKDEMQASYNEILDDAFHKGSENVRKVFLRILEYGLFDCRIPSKLYQPVKNRAAEIMARISAYWDLCEQLFHVQERAGIGAHPHPLLRYIENVRWKIVELLGLLEESGQRCDIRTEVDEILDLIGSGDPDELGMGQAEEIWFPKAAQVNREIEQTKVLVGSRTIELVPEEAGFIKKMKAEIDDFSGRLKRVEISWQKRADEALKRGFPFENVQKTKQSPEKNINRPRQNKSIIEIRDEGESKWVEFKASFKWDSYGARSEEDMKHQVAKAVAGLANAEGGVLIVGMRDDKDPNGVDKEIHHLKLNQDLFLKQISDYLIARTDQMFVSILNLRFEEIDWVHVLRIDIPPSPRPIFLNQKDKSELFVVRIQNSTRPLRMKEMMEYIRDHWPKN